MVILLWILKSNFIMPRLRQGFPIECGPSPVLEAVYTRIIKDYARAGAANTPSLSFMAPARSILPPQEAKAAFVSGYTQPSLPASDIAGGIVFGGQLATIIQHLSQY